MLEQGHKTATPAPPSGPERVGRYELVERIGDGGMAEVHLARRLGVLPFQRPIAVVKKIHAHLARNKQFIDFLLDEARVSALIKHPRVIDIYDVGVSRGVYFIATEHLTGQPLRELFARGGDATRGTGSFLDVYSTARIIADAADGLHAAHEQRSLTGRPLDLVHRDVAPKNIVVLYDGSVKLVDVGIARAWAAVPERDLATGYLSPEQMDRRTVDRRSDIFSLGVVMWEALAGTRLFEARTVTALLGQIARGAMKPPSEHRPEVPDALDKICMRALAAEPGERFQTASEMRAALESLLEDTSFRRSSGGLAAFMADVFAAERQAQQAQVERASEPAPPRASEPRRSSIAGDPPEGEVPDTLVRMPDDVTGPMALGSQHIPLPAPPDGAGKPLVPPPEPLPRERERERAAARRRASAALAAVARSAPLPAGGALPTGPAASGAGGPAPITRSESPMAPGGGVPPSEPTVPGARAASAGSAPSTSDAAAGTGVVHSSSTWIESGSAGSRPRGKGRSGRIDSIADAWTDRRQPAGRALPLPAPPKVAVGTESDASITGVGAEPEEDDDDFTFVDPEKSLRSFESGAMSAVAAGDKTSSSKAVDDEKVSPILTGRRSRWIWTAAFVALGATGLVSALLYTALGGGDRRIDASRGGEGATLPPEAQRARSLFDTVPAHPEADEASPSESAAATTTSPPDEAGSETSRAKVAEPSEPASPGDAEPSLAAGASDRETRPAPPSSPVAGPRSRPAAPPRAAPPEPAIAAAPVPRPGASGAPRTETRAETAGRPRPAPARKLTTPEPAASPDDLYRDGARLYLDGKLDEARRKFQTAIDSAPRFAPAHRGLGLVYERMGQKGRAIRSWQAYLRIAPGAADADLIRARLERLTR